VKENQRTNRVSRPITVTITVFLILIIALFWLAFSFYMALGGNISYAQMDSFKWIMSAVSFAAALVLVGLCFFLRRRAKLAWYFSICILTAMTLAGFFDQIGLINILFILLNASPVALLIKDRKWYFSGTAKKTASR